MPDIIGILCFQFHKYVTSNIFWMLGLNVFVSWNQVLSARNRNNLHRANTWKIQILPVTTEEWRGIYFKSFCLTIAKITSFPFPRFLLVIECTEINCGFKIKKFGVTARWIDPQVFRPFAAKLTLYPVSIMSLYPLRLLLSRILQSIECAEWVTSPLSPHSTYLYL